MVGATFCVQRGFTLLGSVVNSYDILIENATVSTAGLNMTT